MEQNSEEFVEKEGGGIDFNIPMNNISTNESSSFTRCHTAIQYSFNRNEMAPIDPPSIRSPYLRNDSGFRVEETIASNIIYHNACDAGCSSSKEETKHDDKWWVLSSLQDVKVSSTNEKNMDSTISTNVTEGPNNTSSSNIGGTSTSSFSNFFLGRLRNAKRKSSSYEYPIASNKSQTTSMVQHNSCMTLQNENVNGYPSKETYDALMGRDSLSYQLYSHDISRGELESPSPGINLRKWLESKGVSASKNEKMLLFRKIVEIVNIAHSQGIALLELQPSSFSLFESGDVKYIGSHMAVESWVVNQDNVKKRFLEPNCFFRDNFPTEMQNLGGDKLVRPEPHVISNQKVQDFCIYEDTFTGKGWSTFQNAQLEKEWYAFPEGFKVEDLLSQNVYSLGLMLFEFLCHFESIEAHSAAMLDLRNRILPPVFLSRSHKEVGFCFWLLHPEHSSRPTTREILESDLMPGHGAASPSNDKASYVDMVDDAESDLLLNFLVKLKEDRQNKARSLLDTLKFLDSDIKMVDSWQVSRRSSEITDGGYDTNMKIPYTSVSKINVLRDKLLENTNELENFYFSMRSNQLAKSPEPTRSDKDVLWKRDNLPYFGTQYKLETKEKSGDRVGTFFDGFCKFARYNKFEVCGTLRNSDILNSNNVICSLCFDPEEDYIAVAGVSKKIKIFEVNTILNDFVDVQYPVLEMSSESKFSCICWNNYIKSYLASTNYDGVVQIWDTSTGQGFEQHKEHTKRAWSIDFSRVDPRKFASGGDDCSLKLWSINERNSTETIWNPANICCVQFSSYSSHLLAFGSSDYRIYCYDLRHTRIPWCTLSGHENAVSYVRFLDSDTLVSASTDNTLKLWDLKSSSLDGLSPDSCGLTFRGHTNKKNFLGLTVLDGYIACGSETNEVYAYYKSLPMPITQHKFGNLNPMSGDDNSEGGNGHFVSSVCWRTNSQMLAAANSSGTLKILRLEKSSTH